ncbi:MAG: hypothetical protein IKM23_10245 [Bacteroidales bacterium]|nr:hypothetical protein [Bacteroidales bacterium]
MAIDFKKTTYPGSMDPFWRKEAKILPGGFKLKQTTFSAGDVIRKGSFVYADIDKMEAAIIKIGMVLNGGTTTKPRVSKKNCFCIGDTVMKLGVSTSSPSISAIDRSNPDYDVLTLSTAISGLSEGDFLQEATPYQASADETPAVDASPKYVANAALGADLEIKNSGLPTIDAAYDAILLKSVITPFPAEWLVSDGFCLKANPNIIIINQ